jgi:cytochrome b6-f complex iron-sulfur subunit
MERMSRRDFLNYTGWGVFLGTIGGVAVTSVRLLSPNVLYEPSKEYKIGYPEDYPEGVFFIPARRIFVVREDDRFRVVSAVCTHLGCTVHWSEEASEWKCPCHGSIFNAQGGVVKGPAARPLPWYDVSLSPGGRLLVDQDQVVPQAQSFNLKA